MKIGKALGIFSEKYKDPSVCESCGEEYICGATVMGCWCMSVNTTDEARAEMKQKFSKCLCPKCLGSYATEPAIAVQFPDGRTKIIAQAVRVDMQNFHEGMYDFYDESGNLLEQIDMGSAITWTAIGPKTSPPDA